MPRRVHAQAPLKQDGVPDLLHRNVVINESATNMSDKARSCPMHIKTVESGSGLLDYGSCNADKDRFESKQCETPELRSDVACMGLGARQHNTGTAEPLPLHSGFEKSTDYK